MAHRPDQILRMYQDVDMWLGKTLPSYVHRLAHMRDAVMRARYEISSYEAFVHLLRTLRPSLRDLAQSVFNDMVELDSTSRGEIDYEKFSHRQVTV